MIQDLPKVLTKAENEKLIFHFQASNVEFLVIGGTAMALHGCRNQDDVDDLDLLIAPTDDNAQKVLTALAKASVNLNVAATALTKPKVQVSIKTWQYYAEILTPAKEYDFSKMFDASFLARIGEKTISVISQTDLIRMKQDAVNQLSADLAKHQKDLEMLRNQNHQK